LGFGSVTQLQFRFDRHVQLKWDLIDRFFVSTKIVRAAVTSIGTTVRLERNPMPEMLICLKLKEITLSDQVVNIGFLVFRLSERE
jgi:hypothetical protein